MNLDLSESELAFRCEVRAFLDEKLTASLRYGAQATPTVFAEPDIAGEWHRILGERGWLAYQWLKEHGGPGWTPVQRYIFEKECALAGAPDLPNLSLKLFAPVIQTFGNEAQKAHYLPRVLTGEDYWCQGFSEPQAGSDLASLKTRAICRGDHYVVNGSKLWTTHAQFANRMFALVRTDPDARPQKGISFLLIDLKQPGIEIRPIIGLAGDHEVNAVFFDDVVVSADDLVGEEGQGWSIAKFLLENERGGSCFAPRLLASLAEARRVAASRCMPGFGSLIAEPAFALKLAEIEIAVSGLEALELRGLADLANGKRPGPQTSVAKLVASTLRQEIDALIMRAWGHAGLQMTTVRPLYGEDCPEPILCKEAQVAAPRYLNSRAWTIFGGTNEIQRTIIARQVLDL